MGRGYQQGYHCLKGSIDFALSLPRTSQKHDQSLVWKTIFPIEHGHAGVLEILSFTSPNMIVEWKRVERCMTYLSGSAIEKMFPINPMAFHSSYHSISPIKFINKSLNTGGKCM
jgi:hypothetical protein